MRRDPGGPFAAALLVCMTQRGETGDVKRLVGELGVPVDALPPGKGWYRAVVHAAGQDDLALLRFLVLEAGADLQLRDAEW